MPQVKYVGPFDEVELADGTTAKRGEFVDVDAETAGRAPKGKPLNEDGSPSKSYDPGSGLLAQSASWTAKKGDA